MQTMKQEGERQATSDEWARALRLIASYAGVSFVVVALLVLVGFSIEQPLEDSAPASVATSTEQPNAPAQDYVGLAAPTAAPSDLSAMVESPPEATCSGGADGGMDATGNQCDIVARDAVRVIPAEAANASAPAAARPERHRAIATASFAAHH